MTRKTVETPRPDATTRADVVDATEPGAPPVVEAADFLDGLGERAPVYAWRRAESHGLSGAQYDTTAEPAKGHDTGEGSAPVIVNATAPPGAPRRQQATDPFPIPLPAPAVIGVPNAQVAAAAPAAPAARVTPNAPASSPAVRPPDAPIAPNAPIVPAPAPTSPRVPERTLPGQVQRRRRLVRLGYGVIGGGAFLVIVVGF